ncbi:MAG: hypothetical protein ACRD6W_08655, partial [Nitrososphaerales archaeon]
GERPLGRQLGLLPVERLVLAFFVAGSAFFVVASIPVAIFGLPLLLGMFGGGAIAYALISAREKASGFRSILSFVATGPGLVVGLLFVALLAVEVGGVSPLPLGNMLDGSLHSLFVTLLLRNHTLPWTLAPFASIGVTYPQGAPVWMSLPVLLFGWPIVSAPLEVPAFFLALSVPAAYCLGARLAVGQRLLPAPWVGVLFAAFFGLLASWPRFWVGGSFDFALGLPLFLLSLGWLVPFVRVDRTISEVAALGVLIGVEISLSLMLGVATLLLVAGYSIVFSISDGRSLVRWIVRWLALSGIAALFLLRSLVAIAVWFDYPGHVLLPVGSPPYAPPIPTPAPSYSYLNGELNPFVLFKYKVSPIPALSLELQVLIAGGLVLGALVLLRWWPCLDRYLPRGMVLTVLVGA